MEQVRTDLRAAVIEQVMRVAEDELSLLPFMSAEPCSAEALAALGRLLSDVNVTLTASAPLTVFCGGGTVDPSWRDRAETRPGSLWQSFELLQSLYGPAPSEACDDRYEGHDPYEAYCDLRARSEDDLSAS